MELIVAVDAGGGIGLNGGMLYSIPEDLKRFRQLTMGKTLLMGRGTFFSLPGAKPLPGRKNCVLSRSAKHLQKQHPAGEDGPFFYENADEFFAAHAGEHVMLIGGGDVYAQLMHLCDTAYVTEIRAHSLADTFFHLDGEWKCIARESARNREPDFDFCVYRRVKSSFSGTELHKPHGL